MIPNPDDWLNIDADIQPDIVKPRAKRKAKKTKAEPRVKSVAGIPREAARKFGPGRIWGCDGEFVFFRPKRMVDGVFTQVANPEAMERHQRFISKGDYTYIETQDDVQIFRVNAQSPMARKGCSLLEATVGAVRRAVILAACNRDWPLYVDALQELANRVKSNDPGPLGANQWKELLSYVENMISMRGGPTPAECGAQLQNVRAKRGEGKGRLILTAS